MKGFIFCLNSTLNKNILNNVFYIIYFWNFYDMHICLFTELRRKNVWANVWSVKCQNLIVSNVFIKHDVNNNRTQKSLSADVNKKI